jgi:processive 1,2-diacylglycerol beta-glucosyltransferase
MPATSEGPIASDHPRRVLLLHSSAGGSHLRVAEAIAEGLGELYGEAIDARRVDPFAQPGRSVAAGLIRSYSELLIHHDAIWGQIFAASNRPYVLAPLLRLARRISLGRLRKIVQASRPHLVIVTDQLTQQLVVPLLVRERIPLYVTVLDLVTLHRMWVSDHTEGYFAASAEAAAALTRLGAPGSRITLTGVPVRRAFYRRVPPADLRAAYGLDRDRPVIVVTGGACGAGHLARVVPALVQAAIPGQFVVICGHNARARRDLDGLRTRHRDLRVFGFVEPMADFVGMADVVVAKAGSVTIAEAVALRRPLVIMHELPGQEEGNAAWVETHGLGVDARTMPRLIAALWSYLAEGKTDPPSGITDASMSDNPALHVATTVGRRLGLTARN